MGQKASVRFAIVVAGLVVGAGCAGDDEEPGPGDPFAGSGGSSVQTTAGMPSITAGAPAVAGMMAPPIGGGVAQPMPMAGSTAQPMPMAGSTAQPMPMAGSMAEPMPMAGSMAEPMPTGGPRLKPVTSVAMDGPYAPMVEQNADGGQGWVFRPAMLSPDGEKHPILVWGCGSGSTPSSYMFHLSRIASHGFVIYAANTSSVTGARLTRGLDYLFAENEKAGGPLHQKLDLENVAVGGHSLGSLSTYDIAGDMRITNTIHVDGGTFDATGGAKLKKPAVFICGETSTGAMNCTADYEDTTVPIFFTRIKGLAGLQGHIQAAREGIDLWIAWMRWQMAGEADRRKDFLDPMCTFCTGKWISLQKNW